MNRFLLPIYFLSLTLLHTSFAQDKTLELTPSQEHYELFKEYRLNNPDKALEEAKLSYQAAEMERDSSMIAKSSRAIGWLFNHEGKYIEAIPFLEKSIEVFKLIGNNDMIKSALNDAGINRYKLGAYDKALTYFFESLKVREETGDYQGKGILYNNIGLVYYQLGQHEEAISYYEKGLSIEKEFEDLIDQSIISLNIGLSLYALKRLDEALEYYNSTLEICEINCPNDVKIQATGGRGHVDFDLGNYKEAEEAITKAIELSHTYGMKMYLAQYFTRLGYIDYKNSDYKKALIDVDSSAYYAKMFSDTERYKSNLELYLKIYNSIGDTEKALATATELIEIKDSLLNADVIRNLTDIHVNIQQEKDASIILGKDLEISERTQQMYLFGGTMAMAVVLSLILYKNNKLRKRNVERLDQIVDQRTRTLNKLNEELLDSRLELDNFIYKTSHDIQGPLASLQGMCNVGLMDVKDETGRSYLMKLQYTATELNNIISRLQTVNNINSTSLGHSRINFERLANEIFQSEMEQLDKRVTIDGIKQIQKDINFFSDEYLIYIILSNLLSNGFKFYDSRKEKRFVKVQIQRIEDEVVINVIDNGIGIQLEDTSQLFRMFSRFTDRNRSGGIGLYLVKTAVDKLQGSITVNKTSEGDTSLIVSLPYKGGIAPNL